MKVIVSSTFKSPAQSVWEKLQLSQTLVQISRGVVAFTTADSFPVRWEPHMPLDTHLKLFTFVPFGAYRIEFLKIEPVQMEMQTKENGGLITQWDHTMKVLALDDDQARYTDTIEIQAGWATAIVCLWAYGLYHYRHIRFKKLLK